MDSLRQLSSPTGAVLRDYEMESVPSITIVPGDIVSLKTGDVVPADVRLFESMNFETDEALLTGESLPVSKTSETTYSTEIGVGDRLNMAYSSSTVTRGRARGIVVAVGMSTEIGNIAETLRAANKRKMRKLSDHRDQNNNVSLYQRVKFSVLWVRDWIGIVLGITTGTPLQRKLSKLAYLLFLVAIVLAIIVFGANKFNVTHQVSIYAISLGIAIIPESLIAVLSITMAIGTRAMAKRHVIVRKLDALEALGGVTNVCSEKTGTLTQGKMITRKAWIIKTGQILTVESPEATDPTSGEVISEAGIVELGSRPPSSTYEKARSEKFSTPADLVNDSVFEFIRAAALCNLATVRRDENTGRWNATGDPTEIALQVFAHRFELGKERMSREWSEMAEFPFDSSIKRMSVIYQHQEMGSWVFLKGAVERVLEACTSVETGGESLDLDDQIKEQVLRQMEQFASQGLVFPGIILLIVARSRNCTSTMDRHRRLRHPSRSRREGYDPPRPRWAIRPSTRRVPPCGPRMS
jgi:Na+-exporting ATPase